MATSDSEDFESADEGQGGLDKKERKKRLSSSNYSDNALETEEKPLKTHLTDKDTPKPQEKVKEAEGWDDFDIEDNEPIPTPDERETTKTQVQKEENKTSKEQQKSQDTGWDDFDDWGDETTIKTENPKINERPQVPQTKEVQPQPSHDANIREVTDRLAAASTGGSGWGWGWSVDSLISTASAGISNITSQVSQGITTVLETGIGAPDPEELARRSVKENEPKAAQKPETSKETPVTPSSDKPEESKPGDVYMPFGNLLSGVTKFVETTGTKVISGGLDTLETIGKKTMEVLQDGDPGLAKKRAMLGLGAGDKIVLSQVLREAKAKAEEEDRVREVKREAKEVHYENLFDDFEGLVHLEALEMLSKQVSMRIEERLRNATPEKKQDIKETLQQVTELCEMPEDDDDDDDDEHLTEGMSKSDAFHERLQTATQDLGLKLQLQPLVKQYTEVLTYLSSDTDVTVKSTYKHGVCALAHATALAVEQYHKCAEMLLVKSRRSTADECDAMTQMTVVLTKHVSELATLFTEKLNSIPTEDKEQIKNYTTNIFLEAGNSATYIQNAFHLALPILQIGAV